MQGALHAGFTASSDLWQHRLRLAPALALQASHLFAIQPAPMPAPPPGAHPRTHMHADALPPSYTAWCSLLAAAAQPICHPVLLGPSSAPTPTSAGDNANAAGDNANSAGDNANAASSSMFPGLPGVLYGAGAEETMGLLRWGGMRFAA